MTDETTHDRAADEKAMAEDETVEAAETEAKATDDAANDDAEDDGSLTETASDGERSEEAPPSGDAKEAEAKSRSQRQRERRKAAMEAAEKEAREAKAALERIRNPGEPPKEDAFDDYAQFVAARAVWAARNSDAEAQKSDLTRQAEMARKQISQERQAAFVEQAQEARAQYQDFDAVVNNPAVPVSAALAEAILSSDQAAHLAYRVASNPAEAARLSNLDPVSMGLALGRMEAALTAPPARKVSKAPEPIKSVAAGKGSPGKSLGEMSYEEFRRARGFS